MSYEFLNKISLEDLRNIASNTLNIDAKNISKADLKSIIINGFRRYNLPSSPEKKEKSEVKKDEIKKRKKEEKKDEIKKKESIKKEKKNEVTKEEYTFLEKIGHQGKEGIIYKVNKVKNKTKKGEYALKQFSKNKSSKNLEKEAQFLKEAGKAGISPKVLDYNLEEKFIVMDLLSKSLFEILKENKGKLNKEYQKRIIEISKTLDKLGIFHGDPSPLNFMEKDGKLYIIDFGFSKKIDEDILKNIGKEPNLKMIPLGIILKIKDVCNPKDYPELMKYISKEDQVKYQIF